MADEVEDESIVDSWEDFDQNPEVLEEQLRKMSLRNPHTIPESHRDVLITNADSQHTPFPMNQEPKIMILRRPDNNLPNGNVSKFKHMPKSLEQRQVEYAQARLRILGDAGAASEESLMPIQRPGEEPSSLNNLMSTDDQAKESNCISAYNINKIGTNKPIAIVKPSQMNVNIIRKPRGPTEQAGFVDRNTNHKPT